MHFAEPRKRAHGDEKKQDDLQNHILKAKLRVGGTFFDTVDSVADDLRPEPR